MQIRILFFLFLAFTFTGYSQKQRPTKIFLLRHTETEDDGTRNPGLSEKGLARVYYWLGILQEENIDAVYSTNFLRTLTLASVIANARGIQNVKTYKRDMDVAAFLKQNKGKTVLVSGHRNTTPLIVNEIIGEERYGQIDDADYSKLFVVTYFSPDRVSVSLYRIPFVYNKENQ